MNDMITVTELTQMIDAAKEQGIQKIEITRPIFIPSD